MSYVVGVKKKFNLNLKLSVPESNVMWYVSYERKSQRELCRADYRAPGTALRASVRTVLGGTQAPHSRRVYSRKRSLRAFRVRGCVCEPGCRPVTPDKLQKKKKKRKEVGDVGLFVIAAWRVGLVRSVLCSVLCSLVSAAWFGVCDLRGTA